MVISYVTKKDSKSLGGMIVGVYKVVSTWFLEDKPLWPDEVREGVVKYPWKIRVEPVKLKIAPYEKLLNKLSFVKIKVELVHPNQYSSKLQETNTWERFQDDNN